MDRRAPPAPRPVLLFTRAASGLPSLRPLGRFMELWVTERLRQVGGAEGAPSRGSGGTRTRIRWPFLLCR